MLSKLSTAARYWLAVSLFAAGASGLIWLVTADPSPSQEVTACAQTTADAEELAAEILPALTAAKNTGQSLAPVDQQRYVVWLTMVADSGCFDAKATAQAGTVLDEIRRVRG